MFVRTNERTYVGAMIALLLRLNSHFVNFVQNNKNKINS